MDLCHVICPPWIILRFDFIISIYDYTDLTKQSHVVSSFLVWKIKLHEWLGSSWQCNMELQLRIFKWQLLILTWYLPLKNTAFWQTQKHLQICNCMETMCRNHAPPNDQYYNNYSKKTAQGYGRIIKLIAASIFNTLYMKILHFLLAAIIR